GPLLYLHGAEVRVDVASALVAAEIKTDSVVCYAQVPLGLTPQARQILPNSAPVVAPAFSARTGQILATEYLRHGGVAPLLVAAISSEVAKAVPAVERRVVLRPDAAALLDVLDAWLA
ncbi:MAG: uroporphyrinogen-III synthase, partial [Candidatus Saccharibacteria bacterium]|nr:uroporphyrinogen-III synthase [Pseudorhodobacter sp.]